MIGLYIGRSIVDGIDGVLTGLSEGGLLPGFVLPVFDPPLFPPFIFIFVRLIIPNTATGKMRTPPKIFQAVVDPSTTAYISKDRPEKKKVDRPQTSPLFPLLSASLAIQITIPI